MTPDQLEKLDELVNAAVSGEILALTVSQDMQDDRVKSIMLEAAGLFNQVANKITTKKLMELAGDGDGED